MIYRAGTGIWRIGQPGIATARPVAASGGWWDLDGTLAGCVAAYQAKGAESQAASYVNLANPGTYDLIVASGASAPTWSINSGLIFNGSTQLLNTGLVVGNNYSAIVRFSDVALLSLCIFGARVALNSNDFGIVPRHQTLDVHHFRYGGSSFTEVAGRMASGVLAMAGTSGWRDGVQEVDTLSGLHNTALTVYIGGQNNNGTNLYLGCTIQAIAFYNIDVRTSIAAITTAMAAL